MQAGSELDDGTDDQLPSMTYLRERGKTFGAYVVFQHAGHATSASVGFPIQVNTYAMPGRLMETAVTESQLLVRPLDSDTSEETVLWLGIMHG